MSGTTRRRAWRMAAVRDTAEGFVVLLDERTLKLPGGAVLVMPGRALAEAVALEWQEAGGGPGGTVTADALPMTRLAGTVQERVAPAPDRVAESLLGFIDGDLLCYRATGPAALAERQRREWQPWLDWCAARHGARLLVTEGVMPVEQPEAARQALLRALRAQTPAALAGLGVMVPATGSLALGLAVVDGALAAADAARLSQLDELDQLNRWGADRDAEARQLMVQDEIVQAARFVALSRPDG